MGDNEISVGRAALQTLEQIARESDAPMQENVIDMMEDNLARAGITRTSDQAVAAMLDRFVRYSGSQLPLAVDDALRARGWTPTTPPKSTYIRWTYAGPVQEVAVYQNSAQLVVNSNRLVEAVKGQAGSNYRSARNDVVFSYAEGIEDALAAADRLQRMAEGRADGETAPPR